MSYENPRLPEHVNVARESALAEFLRLVAGLAVVLIVAAIVLELCGGWLARRIPVEYERKWTAGRIIGLTGFDTAEGNAAESAAMQQLVDGLAAHMALDPALEPRVHLIDESVPNAFALLGGEIVVTRGLYEKMPSENALAMVLAHELAHLERRDPIAGLGGGFALSLALALLGGDADTLAPQIAQLTLQGYSRGVERSADEAAVRALLAHYGHAGGAAEVFEILRKAGGGNGKLPALLSTHPADDERIACLREAAGDWDPAVQPLRPPLRPPAQPAANATR